MESKITPLFMENTNNTFEIEGLKRRIGSDKLIGSYGIDNGIAFFADIRGVEGDLIKHPMSEDTNLVIVYDNQAPLKTGQFYSFTWGYDPSSESKITVNGDVSEVNNYDFIEGLFKARLRLQGSNLELFNNFQKTILNEVTGAQHTYIYELLQNANDYPYNNENVRVKFILSEHYLFFFHTGNYFNLRNIVGISSVNQGEKSNNTKTIGYKGIGFKTVFVNNNYVYLNSGDWSLRFDEAYSRKQLYGDCPWALMPVPTDPNTLDTEITNIIDSASDEMRVKFALRHKTDARQNLTQLEKVFSNEQILLFIPNVNHVEVVVDGKIKYVVEKDPQKWIISNFSYVVPPTLKEWVVNNIDSNNKIPKKFKDIDTVGISFAVARDGKKLVPIENARVYNYLPTELNLGFRFIFNADFVPNGSRSGLHDIEWNNEIMVQCGAKFADWWVSFMQNEGEYDLESVFDLLPESYNSKDNYTILFLQGFRNRLVDIPCIPTIKNGVYSLKRVSEIIDDEEGFIVTEKPTFSDEEFYQFVTNKFTLAHPTIRCNKNLEKLLSNVEVGRVLDSSDIANICLSKPFADWLKVKANNIKFIGYLLDSGIIDNCWNYSIFLKADGDLSSARSMYYDIDRHIEDIEFLASELPRIDTAVRRELQKYKSWANYSSRFNDFSDYKFAKLIIDNFNKYKQLFKTKSNSISFIHFLSITKSSISIPKDYPIWMDGNVFTEDREGIFVQNNVGDTFKSQLWIDANWVRYIDTDYYTGDKEDVIKYLSEKCSISQLTNRDCFNKFIASEKFIETIACNIKQKEANISFYHYLSSIQEEITNLNANNMRKQYTVIATDGKQDYFTPISSLIFKNKDEQWQDMVGREWMPDNCCLSIADDYYSETSSEDEENLRAFFATKQVTQSFSIQELFLKGLKNRISEVCAKITTKESSKDFLDFLFVNRDHIFKGDINGDSFKNIPILCIDSEVYVTANKSRIHLPSESVLDLYNQPWFNKDKISICDKSYEILFDGKVRRDFYATLGIRLFDRKFYYQSRILTHTDELSMALNNRENNLAFHRYTCTMQEELSEQDFSKIKKLPIYISSPSSIDGELSQNSTDLLLPSALLTSIVDDDLLPTSILGIIHPDYLSDENSRKYLCEKLGNNEMDASGAITYISGKADLVSTYLEDKQRNINFWQWVFSLDTTVEVKSKLKELPVLTSEKDNSKGACKASKLYISDFYADSNGIENFIGKYIEDARFISPLYKSENDGNKAWRSLFRAIGVKVDTRDIVFNKILPELNKFRQIDIVAILAQYVDEFAIKIRNEDNELSTIGEYLKNLQLLCQDGNYYPVCKTLVSGSYFSIEGDVLSEICIGNQVSETYIAESKDNAELRRLVVKFIKLIADNLSFKCETKTELRNEKLKYFASNQHLYRDREVHFSLISQLADSYHNDAVGVGELISELKLSAIELYATNEVQASASRLYYSSIYNPECDFMANNVKTLNYVSERYFEINTNCKDLFRRLGVNESFRKEHLELLNNGIFARYFWEIYSLDKEHKLKDYINEDNLKNLKCIPTKYGVFSPRSLYDYRNNSLQKIVLKLNDGEAKLPSVKLPNWVDKIGLRGKLYIPDCLEYLNLQTTDFRRNVISWITETSDESLLKYNKDIEEYIKEAMWLNGSKDWVKLSDLVALEWGNDTLKGSFGGNQYVCSPSYMPEYQHEFNKLCEIFKIKILSDIDFKKEKIGKVDELAIRKISKCLTYLAWKSERKNWKELNEQYQDKLADTEICTCESISYYYNENIKSSPKSYTESNDCLWYVGTWTGPMFGKIQTWIIEKVDIQGGFDSNFIDDLFLDDFEVFICNNEGGKLPEEVVVLLDNIDQTKILTDQYANYEEFVEDNEDNGKQSYNTNYTTSENLSEGDAEANPAINNTTQNANYDVGNNKNIHSNTVEEPKLEDSVHNSNPEPKIPFTTNVNSNQTKASQPNEIQSSTISDKLRNKWEEKRNKTVRRPSSPAPNTDGEDMYSNNEVESVDSPFFADYVSHVSNNNRDHISKASSNLKRKDTEAKNQAEKAMEQLQLLELFRNTIPYSFIWYKYLIELQSADKNRHAGRIVTIDFNDYQMDAGYVILKQPSVTVPKWIEDADAVNISVVGTSSKLRAVIVRVVDLEVEILLNPEDLTKLIKGKKIRIQAEQTINIIDSLETRFIQLDYSDDYDLQANLSEDIEFIYGPPGTGKTTRLVNRLSDIINEDDNALNILVLTPTNKAADVIASKLCNNDSCFEYTKRYGSTDSVELIHLGALVTRETLDITENIKNIIVSTAARYSYDFIQPDDVAICDYPWDYIVIDEASMIDLVTVTYILHKGCEAKIIVAGDPKQIEPIEQNDIPAQNIYKLVGLDSFSEAVHNYDRYPVETLMMQHRSTSVIGDLISNFAYNGLVKSNSQRAKQKDLKLNGLEVKDINFMSFKIEDLDHLYGITAINKSAFHLYAAIFTYNMVEYTIFQLTQNFPDEDYSIGIVCPYGAEAGAINQLLESRPLNMGRCRVSSGTVHKFQGDECDIMFIVLNPPMNTSSQAHINNENINNVAMSRARDYIFFILPEGQIDGYNIKNRLGKIIDPANRSIIKCSDVEKVIFGENDYIYQNTNVTCHLPVNVYYENSAKYDVRIDDMNVDIQINLDLE